MLLGNVIKESQIARETSGRSRRQELFLQLLVPVYEELDGYIHALVVNVADADDVLQETCVT
ncbi:MAG: hypothetical protein AAGJ97_09550, partial [Planctomycetota bacterium]